MAAEGGYDALTAYPEDAGAGDRRPEGRRHRRRPHRHVPQPTSWAGRESPSPSLSAEAQAGRRASGMVIPGFRISEEAIDKDIALMRVLWAPRCALNTPAPSVAELKAMGYTHIFFAAGAGKGRQAGHSRQCGAGRFSGCGT